MKCDANSEVDCRKGQQNLYFLGKVSVFNVDSKLLFLFYKSFIQSVSHTLD